ncbi:MAG: ATP-binding protein [Burkholderiaceae bacterium]
MHIHLLTLLLVVVWTGIVFALAFAMLQRRHPDVAGPGWWAASGLVSAAAFALLAMRGIWPNVLTVGLANAGVVASMALSWLGVRRYLDLSVPLLRLAAGLLLLWLVNIALYAMWPSGTGRFVLFCVSGLAVSLLTLRDVARREHPPSTGRLTALRVLTWLECAALAGIMLAVIFHEGDQSLERLDESLRGFLFAYFVAIVLRMVNYLSLVSLRLQMQNESVRRDLQTREADSRALIDNLSSGVLVFRPDQTLVSINAAGRQFFGWGQGGANPSLPEPLGSGWVMLREDGRAMLRHEMPFEQVLATGQPVRDIVVGIPLDEASTVRWALCTAYPETDAQGGLRHVVLTLVDISSLRAMQAEQKRLQSQLAQSQKMEALGTLAGGVAHDFNNILAAILGNADLARQDLPQDAPARESLHEISAAARRGRELVRQILAFSRQQPLEQAPVDVRAVVHEACTLLRTAVPPQVQLVQRFAQQVPRIQADATQLGQVLLNLGTNAVHALKDEGGRIEYLLDALPPDDPVVPPELALTCRDRGVDVVRLRVRDNGCGMSESVRQRIFEPFFTTKPVGYGTGLGLPVVLGIVEAHGATITVESDVGRGTEFSLYFPAVLVREDADPGRVPSTDEREAVTISSDPEGSASLSMEVTNMSETPSTEPRHILYLDDDDTLVFLVRRLLERRGYRVTGVSDQQEAIEAVRANPDRFDLMLTDYNMPGMSGIEVAEEVLRIRPGLAVAVASGYINEELEQKARDAGIREVVFKTDAIESFCEVVERLSRPQT